MLNGYSDGLGDALAELNDAYGSLGFGDIAANSAMVMLPVLGGGALNFGSVYALSKWLPASNFKNKLIKWKWAVGTLITALAGLGIWKLGKAPAAGLLTMTGGVAAGLIGIGVEKVLYGKNAVAPLPGMSRYALKGGQFGGPNFGNLGSYQIGNPREVSAQSLGASGFGRYDYKAMGNVVM
jgi:hypothetical protein